MKQSYEKELFPGSDIVRKYAFITRTTRDTSALLAKANHRMAFDFVTTREQSALFEGKDCFECLSPHKLAG